MKLVPALVAVAVLLLSAGTIWVGAKVREAPVTSSPYEAGQAFVRGEAAAGHDHHGAGPGAAPAPGGCDLGAGPCTAPLPGGAELTLELGPRPLRAMQELQVEARLSRAGAPLDGAALKVSFAMAGMDMGDNTVPLAAGGGGRYLGKAILVRCASGRRDWRATVAVAEAGREARAVLALRLGE